MNAGDILATLDNQDAVAAIVKAKADIEYAKADLAEAQRQEKLQEDLYRRQSRLAGCARCRQGQSQSGAAAIQQDKANLAGAAGLSRLHHGSRAVCRRRGEEDDRSRRKRRPYSAGREHLHLIGSDRRHRRHELAGGRSRRERVERGQLQPNQPAEIQVQAIPGHTYKGVLRQVIPTADRTKATVTVKVSILDKDKYLRPEMSCNVTFLEPQKQTQSASAPPQRIITVPKDAVDHARWQVDGVRH